ncbi:MAG: hypothetical protein EBX80_07240, partial [Acidimicrobiia bacterium]|nr:hypothetical protein [Acidimicrobiia bacterium]
MAIKALAWMVRTFEAPVYCYHEIVHNKIVVDRFKNLGVVFVDSLDEIPLGSPIMLSAHGSAPQVVQQAITKGSYVVDSVCPLVTKVHHEVKTRASKGFHIVYIGHDGHEEAVGTMAVAPDSITRVETLAEVDVESNVYLKALRNHMAKTLDYQVAAAFKTSDVVFSPTSATAGTWSVTGTAGATVTSSITAKHIKDIIDAMKVGVFGSNTGRPIPPYDGDSYVCLASASFLR